MKPERWDEIERLCQSALDLNPENRTVFLAKECGDDLWLRQKVEQLLAFESEAEDFIESPPGDVAAEVVAQPVVSSPSPGHRTSAKPAKPIFFWGICGFGIILAGYFIFAAVQLYRLGPLQLETGWSAVEQPKGCWQVSQVDPQGPAAGKLQTGDQLVAINREPRVATYGPGYLRWVQPFGGPYTIRVIQNGEEKEFSLTSKLTRTHQISPLLVMQFLIGVVFLGVGLSIGTLKPDGFSARLGSITLLVAAITFLKNTLSTKMFFLQGGSWIFWAPAHNLIGLQTALAFHFYYRFPTTVPRGKFWTACQYFFYGSALCLSLVWWWLNSGKFLDPLALADFNYRTMDFWPLAFQLQGLVHSASLVMICVVVFRNYRLEKELDQRRRIQWIIYGTLIAFLPLLFSSLLNVFLFPRPLSQVWWITLLANLATIAIPFSTAYAILKHKVFDISVVLRLGLQYLLAKNVLQVILALPVIGLIYSIAANPHRTIAEFLFQNRVYSVLVVLTAFSLQFRTPLRHWIDRRFFREAYDGEQILLGLIGEVKELTSPTEIAHRVSRSVEAALHPKHIQVFYRAPNSTILTLGYSSGSDSKKLYIPDSARVLSLMEGHSSVRKFPFPASTRLPAWEQAWLEDLQVTLLVPMKGPDGMLVGLMMLGEKKSEQPYTHNDQRLLQTLAQHMASVYQIEWLKHKVGQEQTLNREVLSRLEQNQVNLLKECPICGNCFDVSDQLCPKDNAMLVSTVPVERTIDGQYRLERLLGKGGMGAVYQATDLRLGRSVAVKVMTTSALGGDAALRRFEREARASARLNHPNIITVYQSGLLGSTGAYLVMELVEGKTLREKLTQSEQLDPTTVAEWVNQLLEGLKAAHEAGVIHRDLKPENIFLARTRSGQTQIKILDFGLAKFRLMNTTAPSSLTTPGMVMGTFGYMSPEQLTGGATDERSDLFSVGVLIVEVLTGRRPFEGKNYPELLNSVLRSTYHLPGNKVENKPLDAVLQKCFAKDPTQRFSSVVELQTAVIPAIRKSSIIRAASSLAERNTDSFKS
ncbi:MAG: protein kinase [Acidobacteria bacterium]|nr:protein kinase [Acidobacteriota bacterium]